jgi:HlyD family secretion protein
VQAQVGVAQANVKLALANVAQRDAALAQARIDLERTRITSPVNGIVIKRTIERGQTVASSLQAPELFIIAKNLSDMQVDASIDESDVGRLKVGQKATFNVDAFPGQTFEGEIRQVRKAATNVANVVTYVAVIGFSNADGRLLPGMTANVKVVTDMRDGVLKVPNAALRMRIPGVEPPERAEKPGPAASAPEPTASAPVRSASESGRQGSAGSASGAGQSTRGDGGPRTFTRGRIYLQGADGKPKAFNVRLGVSDGTSTELLLRPESPAAAELVEGADVVVGTKSGPAAASGKPSAGPRPPF